MVRLRPLRQSLHISFQFAIRVEPFVHQLAKKKIQMKWEHEVKIVYSNTCGDMSMSMAMSSNMYIQFCFDFRVIVMRGREETPVLVFFFFY